MAEVTYLPEVECVITHPDTWMNSQVVAVPDETGRRHSLDVPKGYVTRENGKTYLPVGIVLLDRRNRRALVELPSEADSGRRRLWAPFTSFRESREAP